jgi:cytochrome c553
MSSGNREIHMKSRIAAAVVAAGFALAANAADLELGRAKSLACQACHGSAGIGTAADIPNLAGQKAPYLKAQLISFRGGERKHELMNAIAKQLSDDEIENLAAFWSSLPVAGAAADAHARADPAAEFRKSRMGFPASFPKDFVMYLEGKDNDGKLVSKSWVSRAAVDAARAGKPLPNDTYIVVENYANGVVGSYAAMGTHTGWGEGIPELLRNGDWSYALFDAKKARRDFNYARCLACHKPVAEKSYVFGYEDIGKMK